MFICVHIPDFPAEAVMRVEPDLRNEKINYKVREHSLAKVPVIAAVGRNEVADGSVALRRLGDKGQRSVALGAAIDALRGEVEARR